jgi:hypothetical protein
MIATLIFTCSLSITKSWWVETHFMELDETQKTVTLMSIEISPQSSKDCNSHEHPEIPKAHKCKLTLRSIEKSQKLKRDIKNFLNVYYPFTTDGNPNQPGNPKSST